MMTGIYRIVHVDSGREYIGQAKSFTKRWTAHRLDMKAGRHHSPHLQAAWSKYGPESFIFEVLETCEVAELDVREQHYLDTRQPAFNTAKFARTRRGVPHSAESKAKLSAALKGRKRPPEFCEKLRFANLGKVHPDSAKAKMSAAKLGKRMSEEARANMATAQRERLRPSTEYDSRRGIKRDPEMIERSAAARRGTKRTAEQKDRMRLAAINMSPEKRAKIAQARRDGHARRRIT